MLERTVICSDPNIGNRKKTESWRNSLSKIGCQLININRANQTIPSLSPTQAKENMLLITGEHGDIDSKIFNEVHIDVWETWISEQHKNKIGFDLIVIDLCDSAYFLSKEISKLIKPHGVIVSSISTCHGIRDGLIESHMNDINSIKQSIKNNIVNSKAVINGSNISFAKRKSVSFPTSLFYSESVKIIHDKSIPDNIYAKDDERQQRNKILRAINKSKVDISSVKNLENYPDTEEFDKTIKQNRIDWMKVGLFTISIPVVLAVGTGYALAKRNT